jgi:hypothetical protein
MTKHFEIDFKVNNINQFYLNLNYLALNELFLTDYYYKFSPTKEIIKNKFFFHFVAQMSNLHKVLLNFSSQINQIKFLYCQD